MNHFTYYYVIFDGIVTILFCSAIFATSTNTAIENLIIHGVLFILKGISYGFGCIYHEYFGLHEKKIAIYINFTIILLIVVFAIEDIILYKLKYFQ